MAKTIKLQIFLSPNMYMELIQEAKERGIRAKNDSRLIRQVIHRFLEKIPAQQIEIEQLRKALSKERAVIGEMQNENKTKQGKKK